MSKRKRWKEREKTRSSQNRVLTKKKKDKKEQRNLKRRNLRIKDVRMNTKPE